MSAVPYTSLPSVQHFTDPDLAPILEEAFAQIPDGRGWRPPRMNRKFWEVAMALRALRDHGVLREDAEVLGVGAGHEATTYILTRFCRRVFATDLYVSPGTWEITANLQVLAAPEQFFGGPWNPRRLVMQHMNALDLRYEDSTFDAVYSSSSVEHFGTSDDVRRAFEEMHRVLRPGGICSVSTEFRLNGPSGPVFADTLAFTPEELRTFVDDCGWELIGDLDLSLDDETRQVTVEWSEAARDVSEGRDDWSTYPHLVLGHEAHRWTSVHLTLRKSY